MLGLASVRACNVPVFRYALERWRSGHDEDRYRAVVFHRGPLDAEPARTMAELRTAAGSRDALANLIVDTVDLAGEVDEPLRKMWEQQGEAKLPWLVLCYPVGDGERRTAWAGPLRRETVPSLLGSPARREIARRLMKGDSVVWLLLESGDAKKDDAAAALLDARLPALEKSIQLPDLTADDSVPLLSSLPLRLKFSTLRLQRSDPAEAVLRAMLLHTDDDLPGSAEPMVFPIFGRGRALDALVGAGINADTIQDAARFLCGACSCQVKRLNPGVDLLLAADWDAVVEDREAATPPAPVAKGTRVPIPTPARRAEHEAIAVQDEPARPDDSRRLWPFVLVLVGLMAVGAAAWSWRARRHEGGGT